MTLTEIPSSPVRRRSRADWRHGLRVVALSFLAVTVLGAAAGLGVWRYASARLHQQDIPGLGRPSDAPAPLNGAMNVLVVGTDSRAGLTPQELLAMGTEEVEGARADTMILVHISPERPAAVMISFPRDLRVPIAGFDEDRINAALAYGGPDLLVNTIERVTRVQIDHYVQVNIAGFLKLTDVVGGVDVCLDAPLVDEYAGANLPAGCRTLRGPEAAGYVRARHADPRGDLGRIERQQKYLRAAMGKIVSAGTLVNPLRLKRLIDGGADALVTDRGFGASEMARVAWSLRSLEPQQVDMYTLPVKDVFVDGQPYFEPDEEAAEALFGPIRSGGPLPQGPRDRVAQESAASGSTRGEAAGSATSGWQQTSGDYQYGVEVLNAAGVTGLATEASRVVGAAGWPVTAVGDADQYGTQRTVIRYPPGARASAERLEQLFPGASLEPAGSEEVGEDIVVLVGLDWESHAPS